MKTVCTNKANGLRWLIWFMLVPLLISACGSGSDQPDSTASLQGGVAFNLVWQGRSALASLANTSFRAGSGNVCADYMIEEIYAEIMNSNDQSVASATWPCETENHQGVISGITAGSGYWVKIAGIVAGAQVWSGQSDPFRVTGGHTTHAGRILMTYKGNDTTPPQVMRSFPSNGAAVVPTNTWIEVQFNDRLVPASINPSSLILETGGIAVAGQVEYDPLTQIATFLPDTPLIAETTYTATVKADIEDLTGLFMKADYIWTFTTGGTADTEAPKVVNTDPDNGTREVPLDASISVVFSEPMAQRSLTTTSFTLITGDVAVPGELSWDFDNLRATFIPQTPLIKSTDYIAAITTDITDLAGNPLVAAYTWTFSTSLLPLYTITASASGPGTITPSGAIEVKEGTDQSFTITPDPGYAVYDVQVDSTSVGTKADYTFSNVSTGHTIQVAFRKVWYVDGDLSSSGDGNSWADAFNTIAEALAAAANGHLIWIKARTNDAVYSPSAALTINKAVQIYGGFAGDEIHCDQRDWVHQKSIIDGGHNEIRCANIAADARLDGLIIQNYKFGDDFSLVGGAIYMDGFAPSIVNCTISNNTARTNSDAFGGALYINSGSPTIDNCVFASNTSSGTFDTMGGAIYVHGANVVIRNCLFDSNQVTTGTSSGYGGAVYIDQSSAIISHCTFSNNSILGDIITGGAIYISPSNTTKILHCTFTGNTCIGERSKGSAISSSSTQSALTISSCTFSENETSGISASAGGAIHLSGSHSITINNSILLNNLAITRGPASSGGTGGGIHNENNSTHIINCTLIGNKASNDADPPLTSYGGGVYNASTTSTIVNSILWDNTAINAPPDEAQIYNAPDSAKMVARYCNIEGGYSTGNPILNRNPLFGAGLHLRANSPCKNQGDSSAAPAMDIDNEARHQDSADDIGADEFVDTDGDQVPDYWETLHGLDTAADDADQDPDRDGLTNLSEYHLDTAPRHANTVIPAANNGRWYHYGSHDPENDDPEIGCCYRAFFIFDLSAISGNVGAAALRFRLLTSDSKNPMDDLKIWDVTTPASELEASLSNRMDIYDDLGQGTVFGRWTFTSADVGTFLEIVLTAEAVSRINTSTGGSFSVGLTLESDNPHKRITFDPNLAGNQLVLTVD